VRDKRAIFDAYPDLTKADIDKATLLRRLARKLRDGGNLAEIASTHPSLSPAELQSIKQLVSAA
jgi:uncharacterized protein (DUF433 family)